MRHFEYPIRSDKFSHRIEITEVAYSDRSDYQQIDIYDTEVFGRILLLDGHIQLATLDEAAYHEALVHIPLLNTPNPKKALVVGGGDGGAIREILKHPTIEQVTMVEIDEAVILACKHHLPTVSDGAFDDPRLNLVIGDAFPYLANTKEKFDLIVVDATDTYEDEEGELSESLFTRAFYEDCKKALNPNGFLVTQADNLLYCPYSLHEIKTAFSRVFPKVGSFWAMVPSFGGFSGYCWATENGDILCNVSQENLVKPLNYLSPLVYQLNVGEIPFQAPRTPA